MSNEPPLDIKATRARPPLRIGGGWTFLYAALAVSFLATAIYLIVVRHANVTDAQVLVSGLGALWFAARAAMNLQKKKP